MSQSPVKETTDPEEGYLDAWQDLAVRIRNGNSFSGREPNSAFLNTHGMRFADVSMMSGLGLKDDGRALAVTDWDRDGDLDLWVSNRTAPRVRLLRNDYVKEDSSNRSLAIRLQGDPAKRCPRDAIGAVVTVQLAGGGPAMVRQLAAGDGFLSQSSKWLHFGLGGVSEVASVTVRWPGSAAAESVAPMGPGRWLIRQGEGVAVPVVSAVAQTVAAAFDPPEPDPEVHVSLTEARVAPVLSYRTWSGASATIDTQPLTLTLLWASWCQPCLGEMAALVQAQPSLEKAGIRVVALNIEEAQARQEGGPAPDLAAIRKSLEKIGWTGASGRASEATVERLDAAQRSVLYRQEALPLPSSFLWQGGKLVGFYKGAVSVESLLGEAKRLAEPPTVRPDHAVPFAGRWSTEHFVTHPVAIARVYLEGGYYEAARQYLEDALLKLDSETDARIRQFREADIHYTMGESYRLEKAPPAMALPHYERAVRLNPRHQTAVPAYARALSAAKRGREAVPLLRRYLQQEPKRLDVAVQLGDVLQGLGEDREAVAQYEAVLRSEPDDFQALNQVCWVYATSGDASVRDPRRALLLAQRILQRYANNVHALDTAAAALACSGQYDKAVSLMRRALVQARRGGERDLLPELQQRLALYEKGKPYLRGQ